MSATLTRTRTVMTLVQAIGRWTDSTTGQPVDEATGEALFERAAEDGQARRTLSLDYDAWDDMGRPNEVTVTVEPGDLLNP